MLFLKVIWYLLSTIFCFYSLISLIENKLRAVPDFEIRPLEEDYLSICLSIRSDELKCEDAIGIGFDACHRLRDLFRYIENSTIFKSPNAIISKANAIDLISYFDFNSNSTKEVSSFSSANGYKRSNLNK